MTSHQLDGEVSIGGCGLMRVGGVLEIARLVGICLYAWDILRQFHA